MELVDTPPMAAEHVPTGLMGTIRSAEAVCVVVDGAAEPLGQVELVLGLLAAKNLSLRSVPRNELGTETPNERSGIIVVNRIDISSAETASVLRELYGKQLEVCPVSAATGEGMDMLLGRLWHLLAMVRVYTKQPGEPPDRNRPFTLDVGSTVEDLAREIHRELPERMKYARIWGEDRVPGRQVHRTEPLCDKDVVEIRE